MQTNLRRTLTAIRWLRARWWIWLIASPVAFYAGLELIVQAVVTLYHDYDEDSCSATGVHCGNHHPVLEILLALLGLGLLTVSIIAPLVAVWIGVRSLVRRRRAAHETS